MTDARNRRAGQSAIRGGCRSSGTTKGTKDMKRDPFRWRVFVSFVPLAVKSGMLHRRAAASAASSLQEGREWVCPPGDSRQSCGKSARGRGDSGNSCRLPDSSAGGCWMVRRFTADAGGDSGRVRRMSDSRTGGSGDVRRESVRRKGGYVRAKPRYF